jgi:predicted Zn-dependent protease
MYQTRMRLRILFLTLVLLFTTSCKHAKTIYLIPIGRLAAVSVDDLKTYYSDRFSVSVKTLPLLPFDEATYDPARNQLIAEELIAQIKRECPKQAQDVDAILIGLTDGDMYLRKMDWQFGFSYRQEGRLAVVACARMDPINFGQPADEELLRSRVKKMITKNIGILYFKRNPSADPKSVLYNNVLGLEELDYMGEDF